MSRRFEAYLAGSVMFLLGIILFLFLVGVVAAAQLPALFLVGVGVIFSIMAVLKVKAPGSFEMSPRTTLGYGVLAMVIGVLWIAVSIQTTLAGYILAVVLIFFGLVFLAYTRIQRSST